MLARAERERREAVAESRRRNLVSKELAWLRRGPPARTSKPQFRIDAANALIADVPELRDKLALRRVASARLGRQVVDLESVALRVPGVGGPGEPASERTLIEDLTWQLGPGDRVGLLGPNGAGKTTLVRLLTGQREPDAGTIAIGTTVVAATLPQTIVAGNPDDRVLPSVERLRREIEIGGRTVTAGTLLEDFGFKGEKAMTRIGDLSGGELRRLELLKLLIGGPNLLVLDEPTNDLDVETLAVIEDVLDSWPGTLVVVSHDRYFLERTCDDLYALLGDGRLRHLPRGVEQYLELRSSATGSLLSTGAEPLALSAAPPRPGPRAGGSPVAGVGTASSGPRASAADALAGLTGAAAHAARKDLARVETRMARIEALRADLHAQMADAHTDHERLLALAADDAALAAEHAELEDRWLELGEALEG